MAYSPTSIIAISVVLPLLAVIAVVLRMYVRLSFKPTYVGLDDWLAVGAVVFAVADAANLIVGATIGIQGRVYDQIPNDRYIVEGKSDYAQLILEKPLYGMMKLSALHFFRRIFTVSRKFRLWSDGLIIFIILWTIAFMFACAFSCGAHPHYHWTPGIKAAPPLCVDGNVLNLLYSITDVIGDILVLATPFPFIRKLHIRSRERIALTAIFLLGALSAAASIVRLGFISKAFTQSYSGGGNVHGAGIPPSVWSTVEAQVGVLAVCLPPLGPLIRTAHVPRKLSTISLKRKGGEDGDYLAGTKGTNGTIGSARENDEAEMTENVKTTSPLAESVKLGDQTPPVEHVDFAGVERA